MPAVSLARTEIVLVVSAEGRSAAN